MAISMWRLQRVCFFLITVPGKIGGIRQTDCDAQANLQSYREVYIVRSIENNVQKTVNAIDLYNACKNYTFFIFAITFRYTFLFVNQFS